VKLLGAIARYVTAQLDVGPAIEHEAVREPPDAFAGGHAELGGGIG